MLRAGAWSSHRTPADGSGTVSQTLQNLSPLPEYEDTPYILPQLIDFPPDKI